MSSGSSNVSAAVAAAVAAAPAVAAAVGASSSNPAPSLSTTSPIPPGLNGQAVRAAAIPAAPPNLATAAQAKLSAADRELLKLMRILEEKSKIVATKQNHPLRGVALRLTHVLETANQLPGFRHIEEYMMDSHGYIRQRLLVMRPSQPLSAPKGEFDKLMGIGENLLRSMLMRAKWVVEVEKKAGQEQSNGKTLLRILNVLLRDERWMSDTETFLKNAEAQAARVINTNTNPTFEKYKELCSRSVAWPHSPHLRRHIERAGFIFRPTMILRDRCVCDSCGVEFWGWRPWHNPWRNHDWSKPHTLVAPPGLMEARAAEIDRYKLDI